MSFEAELAGDVAVAAVSGNFAGIANTLDYMVEKAGVDAATGRDVHVDLDTLVEFYNSLSHLHDEIQQQITSVTSIASDFNGLAGGGKVPGAQEAFKVMAQAAGLGMSGGGGPSLIANLRSIDGLVVQHMIALRHNAQQYAQHEGAVIHDFGSISAASGDAGATGAGAGDPAGGNTTRGGNTGYGGK